MPTTLVQNEAHSARVAVIGAGAMGTSLAAALGRVAEVTMVVRNPRRAAEITSDGAVLRGLAESASRPTVVRSTADLSATPGLLAIFVATKTTAVDAVGADLRPVLPKLPETFVVSFQNGIETGRHLIERAGTDRVLRMVLNYGARLDPDGAARLCYTRPPHALGRLEPRHSDACDRLARLLTRAGLETRAVDDIEPIVWFKGILNAATNPVAALLNASVGEILDSPARRIVERLIDEGLAVARAGGIDPGPDARDRMATVLERARDHTPSMVEDIRAGRPSEVGQLNAQIIRHAARAGVPTPDHRLVTDLIESFDWRVFRARAAGRPRNIEPTPC